MNGFSAVKKHWYSSWWGIALLVFLCIFFAAFIALAVLVFNYWQALKSGQGEMLANQFAQQSAVVQGEDPKITEARKVLETTDDPYLGSQNAGLVIVEFMDFKCPICKAQAPEIMRLIGKYGYKIKVIIRDFPMESVHPGTSRLAEIASCANEQGAYWSFSDYFFANQDALGTEMPLATVEQLCDEFGVDKIKMGDCLEMGRGRTEVNTDYTDAYRNGVTRGTPTYFINGQIFEGAVPFESWEKLFKAIKL
ncbi:MAG: thioredoxin domain-containing protein [Candidatus Magasanikbacteria bacterium]|nr:thioredoxin domain-containing protein [Candidatus Magasanikbacteria bacterium]